MITVSNRLPITVGETIEPSSGGLVSAMEGASGLVDLRWVGWPGGDENSSHREQVDAYCSAHGLIPVYLSDSQRRGYYDGFSNSSLWPIMHYMPNFMRYEEQWWDAYKQANQAFADQVLEVATDEDIIWIHDYHLMLLPQMLRKARPALKIGFFLHTPFPSFEVFRCLPRRELVLRGLLGADQIGFHTFGYLRHFRSTALRILGVEPEMSWIPHAGRRTHIGVYPIGIHAERFQNELAGAEFERLRQSYRKVYAGKQVVLNVERLDYTKGLVRRLQAIDLFLESWPDKSKITFIFVCVPSRDQVPEYQALTESVEGLVGQINGRHGTVENAPIHFMHQSVSFSQLCALYAIADVMLVTPLRDGMNLVAKEYIACQQQDDQSGTLVLSEMSGAAEELFSALLVNPFDLPEMAGKLKDALLMPPDERRHRMQQMRHRVLKYDARYWATSFVEDLRQRQPGIAVMEVTEPRGETAALIADRLRSATKVGLFLDYDGTLRGFENAPDKAQPTEQILSIINRLAANSKVDLYLVSGRSRHDLERWFGNTTAGLVAEHGYCWRRPNEQQWQTVDEGIDLTWKPRVLDIFRHYEGTTPGAMVEEKRSAIVWHYRRSDPEFGKWKSQALMAELHEMVSNLPVEIHHGKKIVEVSSVHVNKGAAMKRFMLGAEHDLVFCAGDDQTDESMFRVEDPRVISVKVGPGHTNAAYRLRDSQAFLELLEVALETIQPPLASDPMPPDPQ